MPSFGAFSGLSYHAFVPPGQAGTSCPASSSLGVPIDDDVVGVLVFIKVEDRIFEFNKPLLIENSPVFRNMFPLPRDPSSALEKFALPAKGSSQDNPLVLPNVTAGDFELLLDVLRPSNHTVSFSLTRWSAVLALSHGYEMSAVFSRAVEALYSESPSPNDVIPLLALAERYDVGTKHLIPCLRSIVKRNQPLSEADMARISPGMVARIMLARERLIREKGSRVTILPVGPLYKASLDDSLRIVKEVWGII